MAFPTVSSITESPSAGSSNVTTSYPAAVDAGDLLLGIAYMRGTGAPTYDWTTPGWTPKGTSPATLNMNIGVGAKIAAGSEDGTTFTLAIGTTPTGGGVQVYRIPAASWSGDLSKVYVSTGATGSSAASNPDSLAPGVGALDFLWFAATCQRSDTGTISAAPTNYTNLEEYDGGGTGIDMASARRELNASSEDPGTFTLGASIQWAAITIAVEPAGGGGGGNKRRYTLTTLGVG
jgi:hypothetical protein